MHIVGTGPQIRKHLSSVCDSVLVLCVGDDSLVYVLMSLTAPHTSEGNCKFKLSISVVFAIFQLLVGMLEWWLAELRLNPLPGWSLSVSGLYCLSVLSL